MADWIDRLAQAPDGALFVVTILALASLLAGFSGLRRTRHIEDVPTARVRSAHQGYVELIGTAHTMGGEPIIAPLSNTSCCWYRFRVERRSGKDWRTVRSGSSDGIFMLSDGTGNCVIDPEGAEVTTRHTRTWSDTGSGLGSHAIHVRLPSLGKTADRAVAVGSTILERLGSKVGEYRYSEAVILDGDPLYAIGHFHTLRPGDHGVTLRELTAAVLREWKQQQETLRERFDSNRDGKIDVAEWERARTAARHEALRLRGENLKREHTHTLSKPSDGRYFLLSNLEEFGLLRRYRWRMRLGFAAFLVLGAAVSLMLSTRF